MEIPRELRAGDILLSEQQREAIELALNSRLSIILGGAGCGKTTLIEAIVHCFRERNDALFCSATRISCCPSGQETSFPTF